MNCINCDNYGWVCENNETVPWSGEKDTCSGAGMPCPKCNASDGKTMPRNLPGSTLIWDISKGYIH